MKSPRIADAMGLIDDTLITEAAEERPQKNKTPVWVKWTAAAACICLCAVSAFFAAHSGMGRTVFYHPVTQGNEIYYTDARGNACHWNPAMDGPHSFDRTGRFYSTEEGPILYADQTGQLLLVEGEELTLIGTTEIAELLEDPKLVGIQADWIYWMGTPRDRAEASGGMCLMRTARSDDSAECLISPEAGGVLTATLRGDKLYYQMYHGDGKTEALRVLDIATGEDSLLAELTVDQTSGMAPRSYFAEDCILLADLYQPALWTLSYEGGTPELLSSVVPYNDAMAEQDGKLYFAASFGEQEGQSSSEESDPPQEALLSMDLETGAVDCIFGLEESRGTVRYTVTELAMGEQGIYFADPQTGLYYHSFADGTDTRIQ